MQGAKGAVIGVLAVLLLLSPGIMLARNYCMNDRSGNNVASVRLDDYDVVRAGWHLVHEW